MVSDCRWGEQRHFGLFEGCWLWMLVVRQGENYNSLVWTLPAPGLAVLWPHDQHVVEFAASAGLSWWKQAPATLTTCCFIDSSWSIHTPRFRTILTGHTVRPYCCNTETEDRVRVYQFMRDLTACRDWYNRDSRCILSRNEICDVINFLAVNWFRRVCRHVCFDLILIFLFYVIYVYSMYDFIINK